MASPADIERTIFSLLHARAGKTICPSDAARALDPENFRPLMPAVRDVAAKLRKQGSIVVTQRGREVDLLTARGPIRLALAAASERPRAKRAKR